MTEVLSPPELLRVAVPACPICGSAKAAHIGTGLIQRPGLPPELDWLQCHACKHVFTKHVWTDAGQKVLFSTVQDSQTLGGDIEVQRGVAAWMVDRVLQAGVSDGLWVDIGCGNGSLMATAAEYGFEAVGVDIRPGPVKALQSFGYAAIEGDAMSVEFKDAAVVSLCDVLEHVPDPRALLKRIRERLTGVLFVSCPNMDCLPWRVMEEKGANPYWVEPEHYHNFTRGSLYRLLRECGYEPFSYGISRRYVACMEVLAR